MEEYFKKQIKKILTLKVRLNQLLFFAHKMRYKKGKIFASISRL